MTKQLLWIALFISQSFFNYGSINDEHNDSAKEHNTEYVGTEKCQSCHIQETTLWQQSHHAKAMNALSDVSPLGNFNNVTIQSLNRHARFFKQDNAYWIQFNESEQPPELEPPIYEIRYSFGFYPLQQYMVEFDDGRIQLLPFAWDSRPKIEGGQRWFDLYPDQTQSHQEFYWKNTGQNWNYMCADCHSTHVSKNYNLTNNQYNTTWEAINVGCEACHGPAKKHITWTKSPTQSADFKGFDRSLSKAVTEWIKAPEQNTLQPKAIKYTDQTLTCAQCHSRHTQISDRNHLKTQSIHDRYLLSLISKNNYYPDGQIYDEVFVYGSYLQSKMHQKGVVCSNCHNPHSGDLIAEGNNLCLQCHTPENYNNKSHHFHDEQSTGAECINCHMPETTYMQIDDRADHSWSIPRPDHALKYGTPDTCLNCHQNKNSQWTNQMVKRWYPNSDIRTQDHFIEAFAMADSQYPNANQELPKIAQDKRYPAIIRASALERMQSYPDKNTLISIARAVRDPDELVRLGAIKASQNIPFEHLWPVISELLNDPILSIRSQTANALARHWQQMSQAQKSQLESALNDFFSIQDFNADRGFSHVNKANIYAWQGQFDKAIDAYNQSIRIEPTFEPAYINKSDLLRSLGRENDELATLTAGIKAKPDGSNLYYSLGLNRIRAQDKKQATIYLGIAAELAPSNANFHYVYALSLESDKEKAYKAFNQAYQLSNNPRHLYALCELQVKHQAPQAKSCINELSNVAPVNVIHQLRSQLNTN